MADKVVRAPDGSGSRASHEAPAGLDASRVDPSRKWRRIRFRSWSADDPRPIKFPPPGPYWVTGYGGDDDNEFATLVAYLPGDSADEIEHFWPETDLSAWDGYDFQWRDEIAFTSRFPRPEWWAA